jgi:hypothetical protein
MIYLNRYPDGGNRVVCWSTPKNEAHKTKINMEEFSFHRIKDVNVLFLHN